MSDPLIALISLISVLVGALISSITQSRTTKMSLEASERGILLRIREEERSRLREKRFDQIHGLLSELIVRSDPQSKTGVDYSRTTNLICQLQLLLDPLRPADRTLMSQLNSLGQTAEAYVAARSHSPGDAGSELSALLHAHAQVMTHSRHVLNLLQEDNGSKKEAASE